MKILLGTNIVIHREAATVIDDRYCDPPTGAVAFLPLLCKVYPAKRYT